ncbi:peptidase M15 [Bradyrhizobium erythrophlei]|uniref:peptidase M15 n=1 Tax=Bradyrhizobium erythrophlei TaxID=1437360 RepID=UPI0035EA1F2F
MNARRMGTAALCRTVVFPSWIVAWLAAFGSTGIETADAPIVDRYAPLAIADAAPAAPPPIANSNTIAIGNAVVASADSAITDGSEPVAATDTTTSSRKAGAIVEAALTDPAQLLPLEGEPVQVPAASVPDSQPRQARQFVGSIDILDECWDVNACVDRYLWALYQRTPKEDTIKVQDSRKVTVKKRGKMVTVTRSFTRLVDEDFGWKDPKAAERVGMPMMDYVIGGMSRPFKLKLFHALLAAEQAGLSPGITSAFRDDYRQSIASGLKAASNRSYHGGSLRGGYGYGLAADVVSVDGATRDQRWRASEKLWKWIDARGKEFGVARPYLDRDPPHLAPVDGNEYAAHSRGTSTHQAAADVKKRNRLAVRNHHGGAKRARTAKSSKVRAT